MGEAPRTNLLILGNSTIEAMATNPTIVANFGQCFSGFVRARTTGCPKPRCGQAVRHADADYASVRNCIGGLPQAKKLLLKRLLNANKIRLTVVREDAGKKIELTF